MSSGSANTPDKRDVSRRAVCAGLLCLMVTTGKHADFWETLRQRAIPPLHRLLEQYGYWAESTTSQNEYAVTIDMRAVAGSESLTTEAAAERFEHLLDDEWGFSRNPVAGLKRRPDDGAVEIGSWRRCYTERSDGSVVEGTSASKWQLHVRVFPGPVEGTLDTYVHWEINWLYDPVAHYQGDGWDADEGERRFRELVEATLADTEYFDKTAWLHD